MFFCNIFKFALQNASGEAEQTVDNITIVLSRDFIPVVIHLTKIIILTLFSQGIGNIYLVSLKTVFAYNFSFNFLSFECISFFLIAKYLCGSVSRKGLHVKFPRAYFWWTYWWIFMDIFHTSNGASFFSLGSVAWSSKPV